MKNSNGVPYLRRRHAAIARQRAHPHHFLEKDRQPFLQNPEFRRDTQAYMAGVSNKLGCKAIKIGGVEDHAHRLTALSRTITIADFVKETKRATTDWIQDQNTAPSNFRWQRGYGVFSFSESAREEVVGYIRNQDEHHRKCDFKAEFRLFCKRHRVEIDERYAWD